MPIPKRLIPLADRIKRVLKIDERQAYRQRLFVHPGHFYSPIVDTTALTRNYRFASNWQGPAKLLDVDIDFNAMSAFWDDHIAPVVKTTPFPEEADGIHRYKCNNPAYCGGDASILRAMILHHRPKRIIEVGSGWSSCCILDSVDELKSNAQVTFVEPYPKLLKSLIRPEDQSRINIIPTGVQAVPLETFEQLADNDILFIDSTHIVKTESDVVHELTEILPRLKPGVLIHFHDIFYPFEYPHQWVVEENRSWNEIYALRSFLAFNDRFHIVFFNHMFASLKKAELGDYPAFALRPGAGLWIRRVS